MNIKANKINAEKDIPENVGDIMEYTLPTGHIHIVWICPNCKQRVTSVDRPENENGKAHIYYPETISMTPSIVCNKEHGGCGWHGFLTNGEFKEC